MFTNQKFYKEQQPKPAGSKFYDFFNPDNRPLRKLAEASEIRHQAFAANRSVHVVHEDSSTALMPNFTASVEFPKRSNVKIYVQMMASLGALGVALQNYPAVVLFISGLTSGVIAASNWLTWSVQIAAITTGGLCSGMVNLWMNIELLNDFFKRITSNKDYQYKKLNMEQRVQYFGGIFVFITTGILFGAMAFAFAMTGPLANLSIAAGIFVAIIMTIQEVETWLGSYDKKEVVAEKALTNSQFAGKLVGHSIALGNVFALSLLFTLGLAQALMALNIAAFPALIIALVVAFTFGAFTEYYFYNTYLSDFCKNFIENSWKMTEIPNAKFGFLCVLTNAFVNGALTYAGVQLISELLVAANIPLPPILMFTIMATTSAIFAGSASFILGLNFWIQQNPKEKPKVVTQPKNQVTPPCNSLFAKSANDPVINEGVKLKLNT